MQSLIHVTVFLSGAALMGLEMLGSRMLAPTLGNSIFVWGSLIGVVLTALSGGYYAGGKLADRFPAPGPLAAGIGAAGLWVWVLPGIAAVVMPWIARLDPGPRTAPLLASVLLFAGPSVLMALVTPWAIRLAAQSVTSMGSTAGGLSALSTAGSIVGTLATAFFLIPAMGVASLTRSIGLVLLSLAVLLLVSARRFGLAAATGGLLVMLAGFSVALSGPGSVTPAAIPPEPRAAVATGTVTASPTGSTQVQPPAPQPAPSPAATEPEPAAVGPIAGGSRDGVIYQKESLYHRIQVQNWGGTRLLRFDDSYQSGMYLDDPIKTRFEYSDVMMVPFAIRPDAKRALLVGLGGGSMVKQMLHYQKGLHLDVAELDPEVIAIARTYFGVPEQHPRLQIQAQDGRQYLVKAAQPYDVVLLDAYYASAIPFHLTTREFMKLISDRLSPTGVLGANIISAIDGPRSALIRSMIKTMREVFPQVYLIPVGDRTADQYQNLILVATKEARRLETAELVRLAASAAKGVGVEPLGDYAAKLYARPIPTEDVPVLTDDFAPVDNLMHLYK